MTRGSQQMMREVVTRRVIPAERKRRKATQMSSLTSWTYLMDAERLLKTRANQLC